MPSNRAIPALLHPPHANTTIFARSTIRCGSLAERDHLSTAFRTWRERTNGGDGGRIGIRMPTCLNVRPGDSVINTVSSFCGTKCDLR